MFDTPWVSLLIVVFSSILEVFLLCTAGYILAWRGVLDKRIQKALNRMNVSLFTPSLLFVKVAFFLSPAKLKELWIIPIFWVVVTSVSLAISYILGRIFLRKNSQRNFAMAASMFMNSNSLPIALMQSLVFTVPGLKWGADDNTDIMLGRALTYLVLFSTLGMILRWSFGVRLLAAADPIVTNGMHHTSPPLSDGETMVHPSPEERRILSHDGQPQTGPLIDLDDNSLSSETNTILPELRQPPLLAPIGDTIFHSFPNSPARLNAALPSAPRSSSDIESSDDDDAVLPIARHEFMEPTSSRMQSLCRRCRHRIKTTWARLNDFMTIPLWASLASLFVACIRPLQHLMDEHVQPIKGALTSAGNCSIPLTLVVLGAYFYTPREDTQDRLRLTTQKSTGSLFSNVQDIFKLQRTSARSSKSRSGTLLSASSVQSEPGETTTVIIAVLSRMIFTPMVLLPVMALFAQYDVYYIFEDPVFVVSTVLLISSPPALTLAQITQAASNDAFERLVSRTIFWSYCILTPPASILFVVIGLLLAKL